MPHRICLEPRCPDIASYRGRCQRHARERNRQTRSPNANIYNTAKWRNTRKHKLTTTPLCERCGTIAEHVHHKTDLAAGGNPWAIEGLESLCVSCHSRITRSRQTDGAGEGS